MHSSAIFETDHAKRHLDSLCKHFGRKVEVACKDDAGWVQFPFGRCEMTASDCRLELSASADELGEQAWVIQIMTALLGPSSVRASIMTLVMVANATALNCKNCAPGPGAAYWSGRVWHPAHAVGPPCSR